MTIFELVISMYAKEHLNRPMQTDNKMPEQEEEEEEEEKEVEQSKENEPMENNVVPPPPGSLTNFVADEETNGQRVLDPGHLK